MSAEGEVQMIRQMQNKKKGQLTCIAIWSPKIYDPKSLEKQNKFFGAFELNGSRIKRFRKPERSDVDEVLLKCDKQLRRDSVPECGIVN